MKLHHPKMSAMNVCLITFVTILLWLGNVSCKMCTRLKAETRVQTVTEFVECKKSYHAACGWFTSTICTFYELVPCPKERNHTVQQYKIVNECCPGYRLDPVNNITCLLMPGYIEGRNGQSVQYYISDDDLFFGLSPGAYAGIICSFLFVMCVVLLITIHILKRKRKNLKAKEIKTAEIELSEKMIPPSKV